MSDAVAKLSRRAWRLSWLTPLAVGKNFKPQTEALIAISRFVDDMVDGGSTLAIVDHVLALARRRARMIPIVDGHHHIWRQADLPWLIGPMQPRIFGPYEPIRRDYSIDEYRADIAGSGVVKSVYVQTNWPKRAFRGRSRLGAANRAGDRLAARDRRLRRFLRRRTCARSSTGSRATILCAASACNCTGTRTRFIALPRGRISPPIRRSSATSARLADYGWSFDLQVFASQMPARPSLAEACPNVTFVLQHAGMLEDLSLAGRSEWRAGMVRLAACPNVVSKLSGLGTFLHSNDPAHIAEVMRETVSIFGAERCLFGSNFPIEKLWTSYGDARRRLSQGGGSLSPKQQRAVLHDTAMRVYRIPIRRPRTERGRTPWPLEIKILDYGDIELEFELSRAGA